MTEIKRSCCDPFVEQHGFPDDFVWQLFARPAESLPELENEQQILMDTLQRLEVCQHYREQAKIQLSRQRDPELADYAALAAYINVPMSIAEQYR